MLPTPGRGRSLVWFITPSPPAARRPDAEIEKGRAISAAFIYFRKNPPARARRNSSAGGAQIVGRRLARAAIRYDFVADLLAFTQRAKSGALYGADVHEHVVATVIRVNEAEALGCVKPLHGSHAHGVVPSQDRYIRSPLSDGLVRSNFWKGRQRLNRLYRWLANVVRPKIDGS